MNKYEIVKFNNDSVEVDVTVSPLEETVWLTQEQMALLFNTIPQNVTMHIGNIYTEEELDENSTSKDFLLVQKEGNRSIKRRAIFYDLDVIISVGYRVKSKRGSAFDLLKIRFIFHQGKRNKNRLINRLLA